MKRPSESACLLLSFLLHPVSGRGLRRKECATNGATLVLIVLEGDANNVFIEDDIRAQLKVVGIEVQTRLLTKENYHDAFAACEYHLSFDETWGAPHNPHTDAKGWVRKV
jgi:hypothetical protein